MAWEHILNNVSHHRSALMNDFMVTGSKKVINPGIKNMHDRDKGETVITKRGKHYHMF